MVHSRIYWKILVLGALTIVACTEQTSQSLLMPYFGMYVTEMSPEQAQSFRSAAEDFVYSLDDSPEVYSPLFVEELLPTNGSVRFILIGIEGVEVFPGSLTLRYHLMNRRWQVLDQGVFQTGNRLSISSIQIYHESLLDEDLLQIRTTPGIHGRDIAAQFYAIHDDQLVPIRMEDRFGRVVRNTYSYPNLTIGPPPPFFDDSSWEEALQSADDVEVLSALAWISGYHLDASQVDGELANRIEAESDAILFETIHNSDHFRQLLERHRRSANQWIKDSAELALTPAWDRRFLFPDEDR